MRNLKKTAENRKKRLETIYTIEDDYSAYGRYCGKNTCVGVWKELLGHEAKKKLGIERDSEVWRCPDCGEVTSAHGTVADQTSGFSSFDTHSYGPIVDEEAFNPPKIEEDRARKKR